VAVVLSAQTTDVAVNRITPALFRRYPDAGSLGHAKLGDVEVAIGTIGMYRQKSRNIVGLARQLAEKHGGRVPAKMEELTALPGVGRKTANVVLGVAFGSAEGVVVDTHVLRVSQRLGLSRHETPEDVEADLMRLFPASEWDLLGHTLIFHGRRICAARRPACAACPVNDLCPSAFHAEAVGRKAAGRARR
jgi:endonuclease III